MPPYLLADGLNLSFSDWLGLASLIGTQGAAIVVTLIKFAGRVSRLEMKVDEVVTRRLEDVNSRISRLEDPFFDPRSIHGRKS